MSIVALHKLASLPTGIPAGTGYMAYDDARDCFCWIDENNAAWYIGEQRKKLAADLSAFTSTTLADVTGIAFALLANTAYKFEISFVFRSAATTTGVKLALTCPASPTYISGNVWIPRAADGAGSVWNGTIKASGDAVVSDAVEEANVDYEAFIRGTIVNGANAGNLQLQAATEVAASGITPKAGTGGRLWVP